MTNTIRHLLALTIITGLVAAFSVASAQTVKAEFVRDVNGEARIEFSMGQDDISETDVAAWVAQQAAAAPVQSGAPTKIQGLAKRNVSESFFVQAASFTDRNQANATVNKFAFAKIEPALVNGTQYYRVLVGPFADTQGAKKARANVVMAGYSDAFVRG